MRREVTDKKTATAAGADPLELLEAIKELPRVRPSLAFRARVNLYSRLPSLALHLENRREAARINRRILGDEAAAGRGFAVSLARVVVATAVVLVLAIGIFGFLSVLAMDSRPGDSLYSVKRFREDVDLAFTRDEARRLDKSLALARTRLAELSFLLDSDAVALQNVKNLLADYGERTRAAEQMLSGNRSLPNAGAAAEELNSMRASERSLEKKLAAAGPQVSLAPAAGALVTIRDTRGGSSLRGAGNAVRATATERGDFTLYYDHPGGAAPGLEAYVELDGRSGILPVYPARRAGTSKVGCSVSPSISAVPVGRPEVFTATFTRPDGVPLAARRVLLRDSSGTASIEGANGDAELVTDGEGRCSFSLTKTSIEKVTRVTAREFDNGWRDFGEILVLGGIETGKTPEEGVKARASGPPSAQDIELDNGLVRVSVTAGGRDEIVRGITCRSSSTTAGRLVEPSCAGNAVTRYGPTLVSSGPASASYRVSFLVPGADGGCRKEYTVTLAEGKPYARVEANVLLGNPPATATLELGALEVPGATVRIGDTVYPAEGSGAPVVFDSRCPFAGFDRGPARVLYASPADSPTAPVSWLLRDGRVVPAMAPPQGVKTTAAMLLSVSDEPGASSTRDEALNGTRGRAEVNDYSSEGFLLVAEPPVQGLERGGQRVRVSVYKRYQKALPALD